MSGPQGTSSGRIALFLVVASAAVLRGAGIDFGLPLELRPDEEIFRGVVARMAETGDFDPHRFEYGGALFYLLYGVTRVVHAVRTLVDPGGAGTFVEFSKRASEVALIQRAISLVLGVGTVVLVYRIGRNVACSAAGLAAATLLAFSFLPVRDAHFGTVDVPSAFASTWALALIVRAGLVGSARAFALAGVVAGLATATRYAPGVLLLPLWVMAWRTERAAGKRGLRAVFGSRPILAATALAVGFLCFAPYTVLAFDAFRDSMLGALLIAGESGAGFSSRLQQLAFLHLVRAVDWPFAVASALALIAAFAAGNPGARAIALFVVAYALVLSLGTSFFLRWLNPLVPALCVLVGIQLGRIARHGKLGWLACSLLTLALVAVPAARSIHIDRLFLRETTFEKTAAVLRQQVPSGAAVACASPQVELVLGAAVTFVPWDPLALASRPEWYAVVPRHPIGGIGADPCLASLVLPAMGEVTTLATFTGLDPSNWRGAVFEKPDFFFYPLRGFDAVVDPGPDFEILRITPRRDGTAERPEPPRFSISVEGARLRLDFEPPPTGEIVAYYLRWAPEDGPDDAFFGPIAVLPNAAWLPFTRSLWHGRYAVVAASVGRKGVGPWSEPVTIVFE